MSGSVMEWVEGDVRGLGGKDWGAKWSPREPAPQLTPVDTPVRLVPTKDGGTGTSIGQTPRASQAVKQTPQCTTPPTTVPRERCQPSKPNGTTERSQHAKERGCTPP
ncbi:hypothetical protein ILYODFUR_003293 [Ilyodon furcidens]|uniref:Uncharacterized protein n=1 Tax=Ilyodon furcidens TaxID=33524 RepID=A0ABV0TRI3_9TELE